MAHRTEHHAAAAIIDIEPDLSNAGPFLAAAMVTGGTSHRQLAARHHASRATHFVACSHDMGATVSLHDDTLTVQRRDPIAVLG